MRRGDGYKEKVRMGREVGIARERRWDIHSPDNCTAVESCL